MGVTDTGRSLPAARLSPLGCASRTVAQGCGYKGQGAAWRAFLSLVVVTGRIFPSGFGLSAVKQLLIFSCTVSQAGEKLSCLYFLPAVPASFISSSLPWFHLGFLSNTVHIQKF